MSEADGRPAVLCQQRSAVVRLKFERQAAHEACPIEDPGAAQRHGVEVDEVSNIRGPLTSQIGREPRERVRQRP
ncbi:MAG TPA: hypothetical protein VF361_08730, partial [Candidatus Limnocylindrales bacterium]